MGWELIAVFLLGLLLGLFIGFGLFFRFAYRLFQKIAEAMAKVEAERKDHSVYYWDPTGSDGSFNQH